MDTKNSSSQEAGALQLIPLSSEEKLLLLQDKGTDLLKQPGPSLTSNQEIIKFMGIGGVNGHTLQRLPLPYTMAIIY